MSDVKWIRLTISMFDDEKIKLIEQMPDADTILTIWIKLLVQAGKNNASGSIFLSENIPYTDEMLSTIFDRPIATIRLALTTFKQFGMIDIDENSVIHISNWEKHQNVEGLDRIREQTRKRVAKHREKKQLEQPKKSNDTVTLRNATEEELELELERDKEVIPYVEIINYLNDVANKNYRSSTPKTKTLIKSRWNEGFRIEDFKTVINNKFNDYKKGVFKEMYLRPETLFGTKFEGYLNQDVPKPIGYDPSNDAF